MSRIPLRLRLTLAFSTAMAVVLVAVGLLLYLRLASSLDEQMVDRLASRNDGIATLLRAASLDELRLPPEDDGFALVVGSTGGWASDPEARSLELTPTERAAARERPLVVERDVNGSDGEAYRARLMVRYVQDGSFLIATGESLEDRREALEGLLAQLVVILPIALLISSVIGYLVAGAALRPVEAMRRQAEEISADTPERRLPLPRARDEISRLGETLNEMLGRLDAGLARERRFVADASHELRTPLATLQTELELATRRPRTQTELELALRSAGEEVERLVRLAEDLLVLARADEGDLAIRAEPMEARELLGDVARRQSARAASVARAIDVSAPVDLVLVGDRRRLEQALENLVDNALQHGAGTVRMDARAANGFVVLAVSDDGAGFPPDFVPHAFERFSRADAARSGGGAGLGLAIADAIARAHGGTAHAANAAGGGADVWLALPSGLNAVDAPRTDSDDVS